jgi:hypothetical protein
VADDMNIIQEASRRFRPRLYIRMEIARLERGDKALRRVTMSPDQRNEQESRLHQELTELYEWELTFKDKDLVKRATKIGIYLDEIEFDNVLSQDNVGRYYMIGTFGDEYLRDGFRTSLLKAVREREPIYRKERREQIELALKIIGSITASITGIIGALIGLLAIRK